MLGKIWKKLLLVVLIVACLFNIVNKIIQRNSLKKELEATLEYFNDLKNKEIENIVQITNKTLNKE